jgi:hypothetical protein
MPKIDANSFPRPARQMVGRVLTDPTVPGLELDLSSCRTLGPLEIAACMTEAQNVYADHFTGFGQPGQKGRIEPEFLVQGGEVVVFDINAAQLACILFRAQNVPDQDRYTPQELLKFMVFDRLVEGMTEIGNLCASEEEKAPDPLAPNGSGEA